MKKQIIFSVLLCAILLPQQVLASPNVVGDNSKKLQAKVDEVFAGTPQLLALYRKIQGGELRQVQVLPEYNNLLNSQELKKLNNSPEMQEAIKEVMRGINVKIGAVNAQIEAINAQTKRLEQGLNEQNTTLSAKEIKEKINLNNITSSELKKQVDSAVQSLGSFPQLYFTDTKEPSSLSELTPIQKPDTLTTDVLLVSIAGLDQLIDTRIGDMLFKTLGIASGGETSAEQGLWVKGLKSYAKQTEYKLTPGYKLNQDSVAIGMDFTEHPTATTWGIAYSFTSDHLNTDIPNTKEKIKSHIATIYGLYQHTTNLFIDVQAKCGMSYINKSRNNLNLSGDISYAKTTGNIYGGKLELSYSYGLQEKTHIIPSIGISYDELQINSYKETGVGFNREINARTVSKTAAIPGIKLSHYMAVNSYALITEIHAKAFYTLNANNNKTVITIMDGMNPLVTPSGKLPKMTYRIGGSSKITQSPSSELTLGYDIGISKKFHSHTGYITARITF